MDEAADIRGIKPLVEIPEPPNHWPWIISIVILIILAVFLWKWLTRQKFIPGISAAARAIKDLQRAERLLNKKSPEPLVMKVTDILRTYMEGNFSINAPRQTTEEFLASLHESEISDLRPWKEQLGDFLSNCDAVKYGKGDLENSARKELIESAVHLVEMTRDETAELQQQQQ